MNNESIVAYEFYWHDPIKGYQLIGILPERRTNLGRITQESVMNWGIRYFDNKLDINNILFIQVTIDKKTYRIFRPNREMTVYKVFYKDYEFKKNELKGMLVERRKDLRGKTQIESGLRWAKLTFGRMVKDEKAIFVVPNEFKLVSATK